MSSNSEVDPKPDVSATDEAAQAQMSLIERVSKIPCICSQCAEEWPGIDPAFLTLVERGKEQMLEAEEAEWRAHVEHRRKTQRPVWTAEELVAVEDRDDRARIAASESIDISCGRTRYVVRDLAQQGFWGLAAVDRLTPTEPPEKRPAPRRRRPKYPKPTIHFDLFGDFGVTVPFTDQEKPSQSAARTDSCNGEVP